LVCVKFFGKPEFHRWPFGFDYGEHHGVADGAILEDGVIAKNAVLFGAESFDCAPGLVVVPMSPELQCNSPQFLERSLEQQHLGCGVDSRSLRFRSDPR
jgi:hypothetical protein